MKYTYKNGKLVRDEVKIAEFTDSLTKQSQKELVSTLNNGEDMLKLYARYRTSFHIASVVEMLEKMETIYQKWDCEMYGHTRKSNWTESD